MKLLNCAIMLLLSCCAAFAQEGYAVVNISACNVRLEPKFTAGMDSQAILGTPVHVLEINEDNNWPHIQTPDGSGGWVHYAAVTLMNKEDYEAWNAAPKIIVTALSGVVLDRPRKNAGTVSDIVAGNRLIDLGSEGSYYKVGFPDGRKGYISKKLASREASWRKNLSQSPEAILESAKSMLGFPYIWAGMSTKGMDCSGYVRTVLFMHDIIIPRDASPQSKVGERIFGMENLKPGDLVFFGNLSGDRSKVGHVGFYLGNMRFIHCLGLVKIGSFSPDDPLYDEVTTGRFLYGGRILDYIDKDPKINTSLSNPFYFPTY